MPHLNDLLDKHFQVVAAAGGNYLLSNQKAP
jgi:hypothetical protein